MNYQVLEKLILSTPAAQQFNGVITPESKTLLADGYYVVFLNPYNQKIGHYTGLYIKDNKAWFFNSLGYHNGYEHVKNLLKCYKTTFNFTAFQSEVTEVCGQYVIYFFDQMSRGISFKKFLGQFIFEPLISDWYIYIKGARIYSRLTSSNMLN
jgi:hypothetical protein